MPNQLNYGKPIGDMTGERLFRPTVQDQALATTGDKTIIFGASPKDNIELWFYNPDGSYASNIRIGPQDKAISITTVVDTTGAFEFLNLDLNQIAKNATLVPGRYSMAAYFLHDEVGMLNGNRLLVKDISPSRTEVRLSPQLLTDEIIRDIYEFVTPSVPPEYAGGLIEEVFGQSVNSPPGSSVSVADIESFMPDTMTRVSHSNASNAYDAMLSTIIEQTYQQSIVNLISGSVNDANVQSPQLDSYIVAALDTVIASMTNQMDPRMVLV